MSRIVRTFFCSHWRLPTGVLYAVFFFCFLAPFSASAATYYWVGNDGAATNVASNWKTTDPASCGGGNAGAAPGSADTIIFDADCDNGAIIPSSLTVTTITFQSGHTGTLVLHAAFTTTTYTQSGGTIRLNGQTLSLNGNVTIFSNSTLVAGTGTVILGGGSATHTVDIDNTLTLYNLAKSGSSTKTIANGDTFIVTNTMTLSDGTINQTTIPSSGTIRAQGNIVQVSTFNGGTARMVIDGTGNQLFTGGGTRTNTARLPQVRIDKSSGVLTLSGTIRTGANWAYSGGTLAFTNSTVVFGEPGSFTIAGSHSLSNVVFDQNTTSARTFTIKTGDTLTVQGDLIIDNSTDSSSVGTITINGGFIRARGNIYVPDNKMNHGGTTWLMIDGTGSQLLSGNAVNGTGGLLKVNINKSSGTLTLSGTVRTTNAWTYSGGTLTPGSSTVIFGSSLNIVGSHTLHHVRFDRFKTAMTVNVTGSTVLTVNGDLTLDQSGDAGVITLNSGTIYAKGNVYTRDQLSHVGTTTIEINGTGSQLLSGNGTVNAGGIPNIDINKASGTLTLSGTIRTAKNWTYHRGTIDAATNDSHVVFVGTNATASGSHTLQNLTIKVPTASTVTTAMTIGTSSTLTINGTLTLTDGIVNGGTIDAKAAVVQDGSFDGGAATLKLSGTASRTFTFVGGNRYLGIYLSGANTTLVGASTGMTLIGGSYNQSAGSFVGGAGNVDIVGDFCVSGGNFTAPSGQLTIAGSFCQTSGTFNANNGTVVISSSENMSLTLPRLHNLTLIDGLAGHWRLDETSGTTATDSSGLGNNGTHVAAPAPSTDVPSLQFSNPRSLLFTSSSSQYIAVSDSALLNQTEELTVSLWYKVPATHTSFERVIEYGESNFASEVWFIVANGTSSSYYFGLISSNSVQFASAISESLTPGNWYHFLGLFDGSTIRFYVNGVQQGSATDFSQGALRNNLKSKLGICAQNNGIVNCNGSLDDVRIYSRALSTTEIAALASGTEYPSPITYTLSSPLSIDGTLTLNNVILDISNDRHRLDYGSLVSSNGTINMHGSTTAQTQAGSGGGGGGGSGRRATSPSTPSSPEEEPTEEDSPSLFKDVPSSSWFAPFIEILVKAKIITGYKDIQGNLTGFFGPSDPVTYAEVATIAVRMRKDSPSGTLPKNPSALEHWAQNTIALAEKERWSPYTALPPIDSPMPRGAVIQALLEALDIPLTESKHPFTDVRDSSPYKKAIATAASLKIISGDTNRDGTPLNTFRPNDPINRAEVSKMVAILLEIHQKN